MTEKSKFLNWLEEEKKNGLIDIKLFLDPELIEFMPLKEPKVKRKVYEEELYGELNAIINAETIEDREKL